MRLEGDYRNGDWATEDDSCIIPATYNLYAIDGLGRVTEVCMIPECRRIAWYSIKINIRKRNRGSHSVVPQPEGAHTLGIE